MSACVNAAEHAQVYFVDTEGIETIREGWVQLRWEFTSGQREENQVVEFRVHELRAGLDELIEHYRGPDTATFVSGLPGGVSKFYLSAWDENGELLAEVAEPLRIEVQYIAMFWVLLLDALGVLVLAVTVGVVVRGHLESEGGISDG